MLVIRKEQMQRLGAVSLQRLEDRLSLRLRRHYPIPFSIVGPDGWSAAIRAGAAAGRRHGFRTEGDLLLFLSLACTFGAHFDSDPQCGWAVPYLSGASGDPGRPRIRACYAAAMAHLDRTIGKDNGEQVKVLLRAHRYDWQHAWSRPPEAILHHLHPRKAAELGEPVLGRLAGLAAHRALGYGLRSPGAGALFAVLMFMLGSGFDDDLLYPWAGALLRERGWPDERAALAALQQATLQHLARSLAAPPAAMVH
jgi:hypothetical protein